MIGTIIDSTRVAARALLRTPSVAVLATVAFALGIGGTVTVFSAVNAAIEPAATSRASRRSRA